MKKTSLVLAAAVLALSSLSAQARDTKHLLSIEEAQAMKDKEGVLDGSVKFYFAGQSTPAVATKLSTDVTNQKTNAVGKSDEEACKWVFLSALVQLQKKAQQLGGNAVVNIVSYYKKNEMASATQFECHAGATIAGVALKGDIVKLK
ncbi:excinuclease ATPase subunit [Herbaspirillum sp. LeCh32-8]|uniref:excinuclease ATPase subunit n=1 Tax=Herbaspirillum sp. LeCh32-8 TaxID=2821356 RepID=UPI001AE77482|nr:excinuclease ATPase subunit [Herbaspirillum sp. LeCh32-8]MBP0597846.1 excinuclease ATPase subunit [Herbaspirillum sp. LeCh32-8]